MTVKTMSPIDAFRFRHAIEPQIAPDASRICYVLVSRDITTDRRRSCLMLTQDRATWREMAGSEGASNPRWAPDSRRLAFLRKVAGGTDVVVLDTASGAERILAHAAVALRELAWSPDGSRLAWQQMVPAAPPAWPDLPQPPEGARWGEQPRLTERLIHRHDSTGDLSEGSFNLFVADAEGGAVRCVTEGIWSSGFLQGPGLAWSADGRRIILSASRSADWDMAPNDVDLHAVDVATGEVQQLTHQPGATAMAATARDGRVAFTGVSRAGISAPRRFAQVIPVEGGAPVEMLADLDRSIDALAWQDDALLVSYDDVGGKVIARVLPNGEMQRLAADVGGGNIEMPYSSGSFSVSRNGTVAYSRSTADVVSEVAVIDPDGTATTLTDLNGELAAEMGGFAAADSFWAKSTVDGLALQCWLLRPANADASVKLPMILEIHGGPFAAYGNRFSIKHQCFAAAGYAVLFVNPRGSIGYGEAFAQALHDRHPGPDWQDLMDGVDAAIARGGIDADHLHVTGTSGGGVLTLWSVTHTGRFRSAVSLKPVVNQESWMLTADIGGHIGDLWFGGARPWTDWQKFRDRSPLSFVGNVTTPTMLIAGERDSRTPISEAQQMYSALKLCGVPTALVSMPGVSHSTNAMRPSAFAAEIAYALSWFKRWP
jgi:dipeptidyl aminopeptidase/acylaminoacyl peptidase